LRAFVFEPSPVPADSTEALPDADAFGRAVCPGAPRHRAVQKLHANLSACKPGAPLAERFGSIEALVEFLRSKRGVPPIEGAAEGESPQISRLRLLLRALNAFPVLKQRLSHTLGRALGESVGGGLFGRLGLPTDRGLLSETIDRFSRRFLPEPRDDRDLVQFVGRAFPKRADLATVAATPPELLAALTGLLKNAVPGLDPWAPLREHLANGALLLATRVSALGLSDVIRARSPDVRLIDSPFFKLPRHVDGVVSDALAGAPSRERVDECRALIDACKGVMTEVVKSLEQFGVSVDVVYRLELIGRSLDRLAMVVHEFGLLSELERAVAAKALLGELVAARHHPGKPSPARSQNHRARGAHWRALHHDNAPRVRDDAAFGRRWWRAHDGNGRAQVPDDPSALRAVRRGHGVCRELRRKLHRDAASRLHAGHEAAVDDGRGARRNAA
jgi:site-specific recombinase